MLQFCTTIVVVMSNCEAAILIISPTATLILPYLTTVDNELLTLYRPAPKSWSLIWGALAHAEAQ